MQDVYIINPRKPCNTQPRNTQTLRCWSMYHKAISYPTHTALKNIENCWVLTTSRLDHDANICLQNLLGLYYNKDAEYRKPLHP